LSYAAARPGVPHIRPAWPAGRRHGAVHHLGGCRSRDRVELLHQHGSHFESWL